MNNEAVATEERSVLYFPWSSRPPEGWLHAALAIWDRVYLLGRQARWREPDELRRRLRDAPLTPGKLNSLRRAGLVDYLSWGIVSGTHAGFKTLAIIEALSDDELQQWLKEFNDYSSASETIRFRTFLYPGQFGDYLTVEHAALALSRRGIPFRRVDFHAGPRVDAPYTEGSTGIYTTPFVAALQRANVAKYLAQPDESRRSWSKPQKSMDLATDGLHGMALSLVGSPNATGEVATLMLLAAMKVRLPDLTRIPARELAAWHAETAGARAKFRDEMRAWDTRFFDLTSKQQQMYVEDKTHYLRHLLTVESPTRRKDLAIEATFTVAIPMVGVATDLVTGLSGVGALAGALTAGYGAVRIGGKWYRAGNPPSWAIHALTVSHVAETKIGRGSYTTVRRSLRSPRS